MSVRDVNGDGILQFGELTMAGDVIVLAAPEIGGLPYWVTCLVAVGGLAAALSTADGLLLTIANALSHDVYYRVINPGASASRARHRVQGAGDGGRLRGGADRGAEDHRHPAFVSAAFSLAAAAFFPALVLGIFWRRANRAGAAAGMLAGLGVCAWYMATNLPLLRAWLGITRPLADCAVVGRRADRGRRLRRAGGLCRDGRGQPADGTRPAAEPMQLLDRIRLPQPGER